jgi:DEAD/DEAH box helicase domain-containing protein
MEPLRMVVFDLETQRSAEEVGGWGNTHLMRVSVGVVWDSRDGEYKVFYEHQMDELIALLQAADVVVGFNVLRFDYGVLRDYTKVDLTRLPTFDLLADLHRLLRHRVSLQALAEATLNAAKSADGLQALRWFKEGKLQEIADYCVQDVRVTKELLEYGMNHGTVSFMSYGREKRVAVDWKKQIQAFKPKAG